MPVKHKILIVDDETSILAVLNSLLIKQGYEVKIAESGQKALELIEQEQFNLLLSDIRMSEMDGIDLLKRVARLRPEMIAVLMTAYATVETAKLAMNCGAYDYICKPFKLEELRAVVKRALAVHSAPELSEEAKQLPMGPITYHYGTLVGESPAMQTLYKTLERISATENPVLLCGSYGTGKTLVAQTLHYNSRRAEHPFVVLDCAKTSASDLRTKLFADDENAETLSEFLQGLQNGTLYLAEIQRMPLPLQDCLAKLLATSELGLSNGAKLDIRVIAGISAADVDKLLEEGRISEKLHRLLATMIIKLPELKKRSSDLPLLIKHFLELCSAKKEKPPKIGSEVWSLLHEYDWPQNISELHAVLKHATTECANGTITVEELPEHLQQAQGNPETIMPVTAQVPERGAALQKFLKEKERNTIQLIVQKCNGDRAKAAKLLGMSLTTLNRKFKETSAETVTQEFALKNNS